MIIVLFGIFCSLMFFILSMSAGTALRIMGSDLPMQVSLIGSGIIIGISLIPYILDRIELRKKTKNKMV
ncbi:putative phage infection (PIP) family protein YhgE [Paenibacillus sp. PastF-3]|uniref:hypothetical protein n=1 Tax=Paenibacillus sp. PastF-3 TaxID=2940626 RepID=UPI0024764DEA|nr:hypothetical protein [Paenibacillus sp. PastF-3]MDH6372788.1 putative phage infection (PIP) family protein YhgE [Paenibacillus sp. PastF-3]